MVNTEKPYMVVHGNAQFHPELHERTAKRFKTLTGARNYANRYNKTAIFRWYTDGTYAEKTKYPEPRRKSRK